jgi:mono/diheme cytochrome c family protein
MTIKRVAGVAVLMLAVPGGLFTRDPRSGVVAAQDVPEASSLSDGLFNLTQVERGRSMYAEACSNCHLPDLAGADQAPSLAGGDFLDRWEGQSLLDLVDRIRLSMPADNVGSLTTPSSTDIVVYILQVNGFPAGADELKPDRNLLRTVLIKRK